MQLNGGWLVGARRVPSPHHDCRPDDETPSLLVVHNISLPPGEFGGPWIDALFSGTLDPNAHPYFAGIAQLRVSAHCLIRRDGEIVQYVPFDKRAWHAGVSCYQGRERCNDFSIGIELEGTDTLAYTEAQYQQLAAITRLLTALYPAIAENMTGHSDIAPVRKTDPGPAFDWAKFRGLLTASSDKEMP
ncbi:MULTISPECIES: 1,6-anhydro-N-acetylmuramyl-L-alanine amidase AmpD [Raoultella]|jgi:AmpD protein|uniref:1,6-anhydro-N-acetylmuramyl-L-alanine amidase AmpD n=1 Tax=Raoultella terrigena TaxID=577 RepID=A0A6D1SJJ8_RAOTE|nr:1,6-anhydro-N-acetylmuramyl-L-alanine amidase AmpD [Raoultella terrigena]AJF71702.1 N-acetyl-anhydromuranmyl-L-alanine amidase [Raoultella ornithinolytica]MCE9897076.1 1,6-anhydro-N-acetylmuramyl-L-alanine amidase AmpD [Raoultella terrigena]MEB7600033.1 1,6-anhydro-N-acetylmuramyl-L-alanine amidase AmpD [Raoultella terrigena]MEB8195818.1 1,6-anhydro-N-acetylmuramyl-L-alanine amidase AmpD [Raoultella terrigena]QIT30479.1 1,6-anhydro-N-acetylmuramyl-L-alanine amidase AmpD [Raoultella terrigen